MSAMDQASVQISHGPDENGHAPASRGAPGEADRHERDRDRLLGRIGDLLPVTSSCEEMLRQVARIAVETLADAALVDAVESGVRIRRVEFGVRGPDGTDDAAASPAAEFPLTEAPAAVRAAVEERRTSSLPDLQNRSIDAIALDVRQAARLLGFGSRTALVLPMVARDRVVGVLTLLRKTPRSGDRSREAALARELADRAAVAIAIACEFRKLQEEARAREGALSVLSHDLRDPIHTISLAAGLLLEAPGASEDSRKHLQTISRIAADMHRLIEYMFDVQRLAAGAVVLQLRPVDVAAIVGELVQNQQYGTGGDVKLETDIDSDLPPIRGDRDRLLQALTNLVQNARKFTPRGTIRIEGRRQGDRVRIAVRDTGCGIDPADLPRVFDRYWQAGGDKRRNGAGLGLAIVKAIIDAHGGDIGVESAIGVGTTFAFTLPIAAVAEGVAAEPYSLASAS
ncbi:MAG: HAMP domain-containing histidine kinase [Gemmatimonadetes bacterium]|nr:HAMP domain-containing histidine kinase [Gemmatimonadota bacterium]